MSDTDRDCIDGTLRWLENPASEARTGPILALMRLLGWQGLEWVNRNAKIAVTFTQAGRSYTVTNRIPGRAARLAALRALRMNLPADEPVVVRGTGV